MGDIGRCIGSGYCCKKAPCPVAMQKYGLRWTSPCPSLRYADEQQRYFCREVEEAEGQWKIDVMKILSIGAGCCSSLNQDRFEQLKRMGEIPQELSPLGFFWYLSAISSEVSEEET